MDSVHTIDSDKPHQKHGSIDQLHEENHQVEFGTLDKPNDLLTESHNGLFHKDNTPEEASRAYNTFVDEQLSHHDVIHKSESPVVDFLSDKNFCGTQDLRDNPTDLLVNDDVEFIPSHVKESQASLLDFEPPSTRSEFDEFQAHAGRPKHDIIEPAIDFKESVPLDNLISIDSKDDKFKELNDSPRSSTPDFLELDQDDILKPIAQNTPEKLPEPVKPIEVQKTPEKLPEPVKPIEVQKIPEKIPEPVKPIEVQKSSEKVAEPVKPVEVPKAPEPGTTKSSKKPEYDKPEIGPKEIFSKYGLVEAFIYWRDPKLSAIVFVSGLVLLLSMAYYSLISVVANTGLTILVCAMGFRVYKHVLQAVQKTDQAHPYSVFLDWDIKLPKEKVHELLDTVLIHINAYLGELRRLFLIENWIESIKFAIVMWVLTYVGSWFNGLTLVIIGFVSLFTLPKVYENNKVQIDQNLALVHVKLEELTNKIKDTLPALLRKKVPEKKE